MEANEVRPIQARDTIMNKDEMVGCSLVSKYPYKDVEDVINETCLHQAEITFPLAKQEGRVEVVECVNDFMVWHNPRMWQAKKKEWGVK